ncbi:MAG: SMP-30/gluconolactonase/LRE family protein [Pseudomonadota bacterium]
MADVEIACAADLRLQLGEGPVWDVATAKLWFVDIPQGRIHAFDPETGGIEHWDVGEPIGCLALREAGGALLALKSGFWTFDFASGVKTQLHDPEPELANNRFNDGTTDRQGRFWAGSMMTAKPAAADGSFYRVDHDLACRRWRAGYYTTNGLAFSPDGRQMFHSDSHPDVQTVWVSDYHPEEGWPLAPRPLFDCRQVAGRPDGGTVDAAGCYWMAGVSGWQLYRITPQGRLDRTIDMPVERPSKPMFGGPNLDVLYVTSIGEGLTPGTEAQQPQAGSLFALTGLGVQGVPEMRFQG